MLGSKKRGTIQKVINVGSDYFPETIWKIWVVNAPMMFRAAWGIVKPWVHPVTQAKINIMGSTKAAAEKMALDGVTEADLPEWMGGKHKGVSVLELMDRMIAENKAAKAAGGGDGAAAGGGAKTQTPKKQTML